MKLYFTGFEPFAGLDYNPSWEAAHGAAEAVDATAELLEVTFEAAQVIPPNDVDIVVHFGLARRREDVCLERYAHNWWATLEEPRALHRIDPDGEVALECALPLAEIADELDGTLELTWRVSHDAGPFVCNATLYHSLARFGLKRALFVHIPDVPPADARELGQALAECLTRQLHTP